MSTSTSSLKFDSAAPDPSSWKDEVNARLAAHRTRRTRISDDQPALPGFESRAQSAAGQKTPLPKRNVAARVAERYAKAPSYGEMIAAQAAAARAAEAAAAAAMEAHAATQAVLNGFEMEPLALQEPHLSVVHPAPSAPLAAEPRITETYTEPNIEIDEPYEEPASAIQPLPAKLLEFPRELVATRKARPRLAEGPLREDALTPDGSQLRIFEVEPETISKKPGGEAVLPEWHSIRLDAKPKKEFTEQEQGQEQEHEKPHQEIFKTVFELPLQTAPVQDRVMAGIVDAALVLAAFFVFVLVFVACTAHPPTGKAAFAGAGIALGSLCVLYQWLFFAYSDATPGMRYAKIALCTFNDENPTRKAMRNRVGALLLSALPLCLGFLWAFFDEDHLGWHDRITQTYQRSYR